MYALCINMCKLLLSLKGYVFPKVDSVSDSNMPTGSLEGERD